jgi:hypothetical protein
MKSKLALFSIIVPCLWFLIVSALAQTSGSQNSTSSASSGGPAFGQDSFAGNPGSPFSVDNSTRDVFAEPSPIAQPAREGQTSTFFYQVKTLKELVAKRQEKRREIVANRREQILRDAQGLGW